MNKARVLALYLPQFHPIPENDQWWGKGFTEWTNVGKAESLFRGHYQPRVPADLGYYDLRVPETREAQAAMAKEYGIEGFCYWHYWFGNGKRLLERPFNEVLASGRPDFPFCLAWANHSWRGIYCGVKSKDCLIEQTFGGIKDYEHHFYDVLPAFLDKRYIQVDGKPFFLIYSPTGIPDPSVFIECWQSLAVKNGLKGIHFVGQTNWARDIQPFMEMGFDAVNVIRLFDYQSNEMGLIEKGKNYLYRKLFNKGAWFEYKKAARFFIGKEDEKENVYPTLIPNWDHTPRLGKIGTMAKKSTPLLFEKHVQDAVEVIKKKEDQHKIIILKSWNEWAEGNYMEPDLVHGKGYLEILKKQLYNQM